MPLPNLQDFTSARVNLGRAGNSLPTTELLKLQFAHARARQAAHSRLDLARLAADLPATADSPVLLRSAAPDRATYLRRPDLGRQLYPDSRDALLQIKGPFDLVFILADGLSASAVQLHAAPLLAACKPHLDPQDWHIAPLIIVEQGRVAIGDEIGFAIRANLSVVLIGERPGLSAWDSLGIYLTWNPSPGTTDADRNCISNIRAGGMSYATAAHKLLFLLNEARRRQLSGVNLKEEAPLLRFDRNRAAILRRADGDSLP